MQADSAWAGMGYRRLIFVPKGWLFTPCAGGQCFEQAGEWQGYATEVNTLLRQVPGPVAVAAANDLYPDTRFTAQEIAAEYVRRFPGRDGIMQPTGDDWQDSQGRVCERICGSPWIGRAWIERANAGRGAFWPGYYHYFADEEMLYVARQQGKLWQEPFLCQRHNHWHRTGDPRPDYMVEKERRWEQDKSLFISRRDEGFPEGGMP